MQQDHETSGAAASPPSAVPKRVAVQALGCKANQEEMECLLSQLTEAGLQVVPFGEPADWVVVNTCTVTSAADSDSRQRLRQAVRASSGGQVIATGCLAQRVPAELAAIEGVSWVIGNAEKPGLGRHILHEPDAGHSGTATRARIEVGADPTLSAFAGFGTGTEGRRSRATLKIQDGCDEHCTFCVIPQVRGASRSRPLSDLLEQAHRIVASGYKEIALTGINTALWGGDLPRSLDLLDALGALREVPGLRRLRLNSLEPQYVTDRWLDAFAANEQLCRHFHLPLQSGENGVLRRMNRRYDTERYETLVRGIVARMPDAAIGCDVMVGFPGETEARFDETAAFLRTLPLAYLHVFSYSERPDTPAPRLPGDVPVATKKRRSAHLRQLSTELKQRFARSQIGSVQAVIPEAPCGEGEWQGLTGNYLRTRFRVTGSEVPDYAAVSLTGLDDHGWSTADLVSLEASTR